MTTEPLYYGILYIIPVKILHKLGLNYWNAITVTIVLLGILVFALEYWCLSQLIDNKVIYTLAVIANAIVSVQIFGNQYYQMLPHRYVFQAIILTGAILAFRHIENKILRAFMWIMAGLAFVWNTDTGLVCALAWMVVCVYLDAKRAGKYRIKDIFKNVVSFVIALLCALGFVNVYNLAVGGKTVSFRTFIYPLASKSYPVENIQCVLQNSWAGYMVVILLTLGVIGYYFTNIINLKLTEKAYIAVCIGTIGFGVYTYYMNRAVSSNASVSCFATVMLIAYICDNWLIKPSNITDLWNWIDIKKVTALLSLTILSSMALSTIVTLGSTIQLKLSTTWETDSLYEFIEEAKQRIPEDTVAFGLGTAQLFSTMDRQTGIYMADWEDLDQTLNGGETVINQSAIDYLNNMLEENAYTHIVVNEAQQSYIPADRYSMIDTLEYNGYVFNLYEKNN